MAAVRGQCIWITFPRHPRQVAPCIAFPTNIVYSQSCSAYSERHKEVVSKHLITSFCSPDPKIPCCPDSYAVLQWTHCKWFDVTCPSHKNCLQILKRVVSRNLWGNLLLPSHKRDSAEEVRHYSQILRSTDPLENETFAEGHCQMSEERDIETPQVSQG